MSFAVVYLGEHYVTDAVVGLTFGLLSFVIAEHIHWNAGHRSDALFAPRHALDGTAWRDSRPYWNLP